MTIRLDRLVLWLVGLLCLGLTLTVSPWVLARATSGQRAWTDYRDEHAFPSAMPDRVQVLAGPGVDVVIYTDTHPNMFVEAATWLGEPVYDIQPYEDPEGPIVVAECRRIFDRPLPRRLCHIAINLQLPRGTHVEAWTSDGGTVRAGSPDITLTLNGGA